MGTQDISVGVSLQPYKFSNPNKRVFAQVKHWSQNGFKSYKDFRGFTYNINTGLPSTWQLIAENDDEIVRLPEIAQIKLKSIIDRATIGLTPAQQLAIWMNLTKGNIAYCDFGGWDNGYADFIQGLNLNKPGISPKAIITSGSTVEVLFKNSTYSKIKAFDLKNNMQEFLDSDPWKDFWGWMPCVISRDRPVLDAKNRPTGKIFEEIFPFPRTESIGGNYIYMPILAWGKNYHVIKTSQLRFMTEDEVYPANPLLNWAGSKTRDPRKERICSGLE